MFELVEAGLAITVIGMGVVFILLTLLVGIIRAMSAFALAIGGPAAAATPNRANPATTAAGDDDEVLPVIAAAISAYRKKRDPKKAG